MKIIQNQPSVEDSSESGRSIFWSLLPSQDEPRSIGPGFWSLGSALSLILNVVLIIIVIILGVRLFAWKKLITDDVVGGLYYNFILMDQATIASTVEVEDTMPVQFDLPLKQETTVRLTQPTRIDGARVTLSTGGLNIVNAPADIVLPEGTVLPVELDLVVPVNTTVPVQITVPVNIPLNETELHAPFVGLQEVVSPIYWWLRDLPSSWWEVFTGN
jgi:hypothetical protein